MGRWSRCVVFLAVVVTAASAPGTATALPDARDVMLDDVGGGFELVSEQPGSLGSLTRTWRRGVRELSITGFPVMTPPGVHALFEVLTTTDSGLDVVPETSLELGAWLVPVGGAPGDLGFSALVVASRDHLFSISLVVELGADVDAPAFVLDLAERQVAAAGGQPSDAPPLPTRSVDDADLLPYLPDVAPAGYGLSANPLTVTGAAALETDGLSSPEAADFLNDRARNVARAWASPELSVAVGITQYPYEIFAAAGLANFADLEPLALAPGALAWLPDSWAFREPEVSQVGAVFRRGDLLVTVLVGHTPPADEDVAAALLVEAVALAAERIPPGDTWSYEFPSPPTRLAWLGLTAGFVTAGVAGSRLVARLRAHHLRRKWSASGPLPSPDPPLPPPGSPPVQVVDLEEDAAALRRRGATVAGAQLLTVNVVVVALAGDFALAGMVVAAVAMLAGLAFSRWWLRRELALLGPAAPPRAFVLPRWSGAVMGAVAFVVLGIGVSYMLKGVRYTIANPSLAHLRWSDMLGISPRGVGYVFALGGLAVTALGSVLYRIARALGRADARRVLQVDPRPPALYLRSFDDDSVPLPTIASARRPLFELFSLRGADPFEEAVAWELDTYGPVVAVGRPGGSLQSLGAAREHLPDSTWHGEIAQRMQDAGLVVLAPGETAGLEWELQEIVRGDHLDKTIFLFPPLPPPDLARRWDHTADVLRRSGAHVGTLTEAAARVHTVRVEIGGGLRATVASSRDEATYRTAVDRAVDTHPGRALHETLRERDPALTTPGRHSDEAAYSTTGRSARRHSG